MTQTQCISSYLCRYHRARDRYNDVTTKQQKYQVKNSSQFNFYTLLTAVLSRRHKTCHTNSGWGLQVLATLVVHFLRFRPEGNFTGSGNEFSHDVVISILISDCLMMMNCSACVFVDGDPISIWRIALTIGIMVILCSTASILCRRYNVCPPKEEVSVSSDDNRVN